MTLIFLWGLIYLVIAIVYMDKLAVGPGYPEGIIDLAQIMLKSKPKLYPVVDDDGYLLGIITRSDVLGAIDKELHSHYGKVG